MKSSFFKNYRLLLGLLIAGLALMIGPYIILNIPLEYGGDLKPSWYAFYSELQNLVSISNLIKNGTLPFYSFKMFLGNNFWASKGFYVLGDIFNYLTLWLPVHFYTVFEIQTVIKVILSGSLFYFYLSKLNSNHKVNVIGALSYALSSWVVFFIGQLSFASFYALLPLYLIGIEAYLNHKRKLLFIAATAILLFTNYYLFYSLSLFTIIYFSYRYYLINKGFKKFIPSTLIIIAYYFLGVLITSVLTIPTVLYMFGSDRVGGFWFNDLFYMARIYLHQLVALFTPTHAYIYLQNPFETGYHTTRELLLWGGSLSSLLLTQVMWDKDKQFKIATLIAYLVMIIILIFPMGGSVMHGFSEASFRWTFLFIIFNILVSNRYLSQLDHLNLKVLMGTLVLYLFLGSAVLLYRIYELNALATLFETFPRTLMIYGINFLIISLMVMLILRRNKYMLTLLILLSFVELAGFASYNVAFNRMNKDVTWDFTERATSVLQSYPNELNNYLNGLDANNPNLYYRVYVPHESLYWSYSHNMNIHYQLNGLMTYDSTYSPSFNDLKNIAPQVKDFESNWIFNIKDPQLVDFLNVKYAIVTNESELPHQDFTLINDQYRGSLMIYANDRYRSLGVSYTDVTTYSVLDEKYKNDTAILNDLLVVKAKDYPEIKAYIQSDSRSFMQNISYYDNQLHGLIESDASSFMVLTLPYDDGWKIQINGQEVKKYQVNGGFIGIPIQAGENVIDMYFVPEGFKLGFILSAISILAYLTLFVFDYKKRKTVR